MTTAEMVDTWLPGEIRLAAVVMRLADGTTMEITDARVMILAVRPGHDIRTINILWARIVPLGGGLDGPHLHESRWQLTHAGGGQPVDDRGPVLVHLRDLLGHYQPLDPAYNSLEHLADEAVATVVRRDQWQAAHRPAGLAEAAIATERAAAEAATLRGHRDQLIREHLSAGVSAQDVAATSGLKVARIYQIRDGHR